LFAELGYRRAEALALALLHEQETMDRIGLSRKRSSSGELPKELVALLGKMAQLYASCGGKRKPPALSYREAVVQVAGWEASDREVFLHLMAALVIANLRELETVRHRLARGAFEAKFDSLRWGYEALREEMPEGSSRESFIRCAGDLVQRYSASI
jgi:hypothetical protein